MKIVIHDFGGYPFTAQLCRALAARGDDVVYMFASGMKQPRARIRPMRGEPATIQYIGIAGVGRYRRAAGPLRLLQEARYGAALGRAIVHAEPDVVMSANSPLDAQIRALDAAHSAGAGFVHWLQDVYSLAVSSLLARRLALAGRIAGTRFERLEKRVLRTSEHVVAIADAFRPVLDEWGLSVDNVTVIPNWAPLDEIEPRPKRNLWSEKHGYETSPLLLYAGTLGRKHDPTVLIRLAESIPAASVAVVAEGTGVDALRRIASLPVNLRILPMQPISALADMLGSADVLVSLLEPEASEFSVPSKVLTYLAAGKPILGAMPAENPASQAIKQAAAGIVVEPADTNGFIEAGRMLMMNADLRSRLGDAGRAYAMREFAIERKADQFSTVLHAAAAGRT